MMRPRVLDVYDRETGLRIGMVKREETGWRAETSAHSLGVYDNPRHAADRVRARWLADRAQPVTAQAKP